MAKTYSVYDLVTGLATGQLVSVPEADLLANTPAGCGLLEGVRRPGAPCIDLSTGMVIEPEQDTVPPRPDDSQDYTWDWSQDLHRWLPTSTLHRRRLDLLARIDAAITQAEGGTDRALRELVLASGLPAAALARMQAVEDRVAELRALRASALGAMDFEDLAEIERQQF